MEQQEEPLSTYCIQLIVSNRDTQLYCYQRPYKSFFRIQKLIRNY